MTPSSDPRRPRLSLRLVSGAITAGLVLVAVVVFSVSAFTLSGLSAARHRQTAILDAAVASSARLLDNYLDQETGLRGYVAAGDPVFLQPYQAAVSTQAATEAGLARLVSDVPGAPSELVQVEVAQRAWRDSYAQAAITEVAGGQIDQARQVNNVAQGKALFDTVRAKMRVLNSTIGAAQQASERVVAQREAQLWVVLAVSLAAFLGAAAAASLTYRRLVVIPLALLGEQVAAVADGDIERRLSTRGPTEVTLLGDNIETMRARLVAAIDDTRRSAEALSQEGPAVSALRRALTSRSTSLAGVAVAGRLQPATGLLAGDWWDVFALSERRTGLVVGDVAGHGPAAGVYALQLKYLIANALRRGLEPGAGLCAALEEANAASDELFATAFVAVIDPVRSQLHYANAGHPEGLLLLSERPVSKVAPPESRRVASNGSTTLSLAQTGPLLAPIVVGWSWATRTQDLDSGDTLIAMTDGVTEARNGAGEQFGRDRIADVAAAMHHADPADVADAIIDAANRFSATGRSVDDRTIVVIRLLES